MQNIIVEGIVTGKDPELLHTNAGTAYCRFTICDSKYVKDKSGKASYVNTYFRCVAWRQKAEFIAKCFKVHTPIGACLEYSDVPYQKNSDGYGIPNPQFTVLSTFFPVKAKETNSGNKGNGEFTPVSGDSTAETFATPTNDFNVSDINFSDDDVPF